MNKGFTILEIMVTIAIFAIGILALTKLQILSIKGTGFNKEATTATSLAQEVIETFKEVPFGTVPEACGVTRHGMTVTCTPTMGGVWPFRYNDIVVTVAWGVPTNRISVATTIAEP